MITTASLRVPLVTDRIALAEPVKADYLFTDASKSKHGLTVAYAANEAGLAQPARTEVSGHRGDQETRCRRGHGVRSDAGGENDRRAGAPDDWRIPTWAPKAAMLSDLRLTAKLSSMKRRAGPCARRAMRIQPGKGQVLQRLVEFSHSPASGERGGRAGRGSGGGSGGRGRRAGALSPATERACRRAPIAAYIRRLAVAGLGFGRGRGGQTFRLNARNFPVSPPRPRPIPMPIRCSRSPGPSPPKMACRPTPPGRNLYAEAVDLARKADAVVLVVGLDGFWSRNSRTARASSASRRRPHHHRTARRSRRALSRRSSAPRATSPWSWSTAPAAPLP